MFRSPQSPQLSRRTVLRSSGAGFGYLALAGLLGQDALKSQASAAVEQPLLPKAPVLPTKAKRIIFIFMEGAMSQHDTFDYKPELIRSNGKSGPGGGTVTASKFRFKQYGETGTYFSELLPNIAKHADKMCWLRGLHTDTPAHPQAVVQLHTGSANAALTRPSMGSWLLYGLGTDNQDLPGYVTINPPPNFGGAVNYGSAFLPAHYQGTRITDQGYLPNLKAASAAKLQRKQLDLIQGMNRDFARQAGSPDPVDGIIASYELGFRMQDKVPELLDISKEPEHIRDAYGVKDGAAGSFARQCLMARRLSEAGVRFVEICQGGWDHHNNLHKGLLDRTASIDQPTAALLSDLEARGMLNDTLVLFGSEFGRLPTAQGQDGRDHNITGYSMFLAGAGVKKGFTYGATDELGIKAVEGRMHTNDLHATLLALMGLDHERLTYRYAGRDFRLTDVAGEVVKDIFA
ncbi:DUF1501 domain-containing protein [Verrucomicrobium sp. BvORR034]|jgi:hypothetical protein|uniref:DUF1501 domain-containing protein n=1 Tax=Verrucomicrobium sp. BvORR034 TaxID=1396418 RepID=UPI0006786C6B|nr:DUF1501 domain-containing protein [Verrucomicrobium sp. BvORR034]